MDSEQDLAVTADFKKPARIVNSEALERKLARDPLCRMCRKSRGADPHHVVLKSKRGDDVEDNIVPLCRECHRRYHAQARGYIDLTREETAYVLFKLGDEAESYAKRRRLVLDRA